MLNPASPQDRAPLTVAILSVQHVHAAGYAAALAARDDVRLLVADPDGLGHDGPGEVVDSYAAAWDARPDAVIVCSTNVDHRDLVLEAARRGVAVLCEKPLATTPADAEAMVAACAQAGVVLMTAYPVHFSPAVAALRKALTSGRIGEVVGITGVNNGKLPRGRGWFTDTSLAGGGALADHVVHVAEVLDAVLGEPATVHAVSNRLLHADRAGEGAETGGLVTLTYPSGLVATIDCSWSMPDDAPTWGGVSIQALGTAGQVRVEPFAERVEGFGQWHPYGPDLDALLLDAFLGAVRSGITVEPSGEVGLRTVRVVEAAQRSVAQRGPVPLSSRPCPDASTP